jgi:hypothetical protein
MPPALAKRLRQLIVAPALCSVTDSRTLGGCEAGTGKRQSALSDKVFQSAVRSFATRVKTLRFKEVGHTPGQRRTQARGRLNRIRNLAG